MDFNLNINLASEAHHSINKPVRADIIYDHLVIGGGPSGLNAALYAKRKGLEVGIIAKGVGGQLVNTSLVENYLGLNNYSGDSLMSAFRGHVSDLEIPITEGVEVTDIGKEEGLFVIRTDSDKVFRTKTLLLATGSEPRRLGIKGEKEFAGKGVAYCAICDAPFFKNRDVIIAGGGNSAVEAAIDLAKVATSVTIVHRSKFRADQILVDQLYTNEKITVHLETQIEEILGEQFMTSIQVLDKHTGEKRIIQADGIFIEIGNLPNSGLFKDLVALNDQGEVIVNYKNETSVPGIFAAGDVTDGPYKQIIIATSEGAKAALSASEYINKQPITGNNNDFMEVIL